MTWRAYLDESFDSGPWGVRLQLADVREDSTTYLLPNGELQKVTDVARAVKLDQQTGILLPRDPEALRAVAEALSHHVPAQQEIARLEEALTVERRRVDQVLNDLLAHHL